jgi:hypothetical protein
MSLDGSTAAASPVLGSSPASAIDPSIFYHEKQHLGHCAVHALNNLFQEEWSSYDMLNKIAIELHVSNGCVSDSMFGFNPFKSTIPFMGYFDISCIIKALEQRNCRICEHFLKVSDVKSYDFFPESGSPSPSTVGAALPATAPTIAKTVSHSNCGEIVGLIVNSEDHVWGLGTSTHWICLLKLREGKGYVNLDSKMLNPVLYLETPGRKSGLIDYLVSVLTPSKSHIRGQVFVVSRNIDA